MNRLTLAQFAAPATIDSAAPLDITRLLTTITDNLGSPIAESRPSRAPWLDWLDVEISFGHRGGPTPWRIEHSTLPFREGQTFSRPDAILRRGHQTAVEGRNGRRWMILDWNPDAPP